MTSSSAVAALRVGGLLFVCMMAASFVFVTSLFSQRSLVGDRAMTPCDPDATAPFQVDQVIFLLVDALTPTVAVGPARARDTPHKATFTALRERLMWEAPDQVGSGSPYADVAGFVSVADSPTTTSQRLKAMMTGSIPAFIEAGQNFNSDAVEEDNLIAQLRGRATVLGDDTWLRLFPDTTAEGGAERTWLKAHVYPSFDVRDLDTVDAGVLRHINDAVRMGKDAPFVIGHFLGVDHAGHSFNARHELLYRKVKQLNIAVRNVTSLLASSSSSSGRTLLVVLGDHGMTESGDHGGGMPEETDTFLFAHVFDHSHHHEEQRGGQGRDLIKRARAASSIAREHARRRKLLANDLDRVYRSYDFIEESARKVAEHRSGAGDAGDGGGGGPFAGIGAIHQIDLLPTLAVMLGLPIPRSSVGRVIPEVLMLAGQYAANGNGGGAGGGSSSDHDADAERSLRHALQSVLTCNAEQMFKMASHDVKNFEDPPRTFDDNGEADNGSRAHLDDLWRYTAEVARQTRQAFGTMDDQGLWMAAAAMGLITIGGLAPVAVLGGTGLLQSTRLDRFAFVAGAAVIGVAAGGRTAGLLDPEVVSNALSLPHDAITGKAIDAVLVVIIACALGAFRLPWLPETLKTLLGSSPAALGAVLIFAARVATAFSNSFVVDEESIVMCLLGCALLNRAMPAQPKQLTKRAGLAPVLVMLVVSRVMLALGQRDRTFEEEQIKAESRLRSAILTPVLASPLIAGNPVAGVVYAVFDFVVYRSVLVHVFAVLGLAFVAVAGRAGATPSTMDSADSIVAGRTVRRLCLGIVLMWSLCLCKAETAVPRAVHAAVVVAYLWWSGPAVTVRSAHASDEDEEEDEDMAQRPSRVAAQRGKCAMHFADAVVLHCLTWVGFFACGFQATFTTIDWHSAFVGVPEYSFVAGAVLVFTHTAAPAFTVAFAVCNDSPRPFVRRRRELGLRLVALQLIHLAVASVGLALHRRHLMVWEIFMPHYVFALGYALATCLAWPVAEAVLGLVARV